MTLSELSADFLTQARGKAIRAALSRAGKKPVNVCNLAGSSPSVLLASLPADKIPVMVVGDSLDDAGYLYHDLTRILGEEAVAMLPSAYKRDIKYGQIDPPSEILRTEALGRWHSDPALRFVVTYPEAMAEQVASAEAIESHTLHLDTSKVTDLTETVKWLRTNGFTEVDYVYEPGQFALRGSILDIFGYSHELPYRLDFFGDEIDSLRTFNVETQLSEQRLDQVSITSDVASSAKGISLLDFIDPQTLIAVRDADYTLGRIAAIASETFSESAMIADEGDRKAMDRVVDAERFAERFPAFRQLRFSAAGMPREADAAIDFQCSPQALYHKNFDLIADSFKHFLADGYTIFILSDSEKQIERLRTIFEDRRDDIVFTPVDATLHEGFVDHVTRRCVFTDHQIFDRFHKYNLKSDRARSGKVALSLKELSAIEPGDYIVHVDHGVGKFAGLYRTNVAGRTQEMIKLTYANDDIIFVSIHSLHKLAKYRGKEGVPPKINKLGTGAWNRVKERTKSKLKDIARDLIRLYADRKNQKGFQFSPDSYMQHELEASFIYEDTPDQLTATKAVKADMESDRPMDRLICGDVGFGKTEVAIRAAFKAAADNKQTAILVPTTVLAYQHYQTFSRRLKDFPVRVDYISRARTPKQVKQILTDLAEGKIDILIGTHKLIGKSVKFKDLGLLVVDEEQKFGVAVKEKLKQMKTNVDTLTMSATPIPRTLQFSLMGARDLSAITTPPANRYPIVTTVAALGDDIITEAVNFEMSRNGQVFMVNNRIEGLNELEAMLHRLVPDARIIKGHGQMPPEQLEKAIIDFANHDYDILLSTTIIESGIDMPNVNTIIINNAHNFGLSELHQLRGRVGRSSRKAFCYLTVPPHVALSPTSRRRLQAIENFSDLGSGIHIAMQDLDIRGAGNLLGAEQSGFIADIGFETYQKIMNEAIAELRAEGLDVAGLDTREREVVEQLRFIDDAVIEIEVEASLPDAYVAQQAERLKLYRELDSTKDEAALQAFEARLVDRFGPLPRAAQELLNVVRLRWEAIRLGMERVKVKNGLMIVHFVGEENSPYYKSEVFMELLRRVTQRPDRFVLKQHNNRLAMTVRQIKGVEDAWKVLREL